MADTSIVIVAGPTASGKSALALALAEEFTGTIINADSQQVYRDLAVLTARPTAVETARIPHALYGVIDASEACSAGRWLALARGEISAAHAAGRVPILVGGSGLYLEALLRGLAELPPIAQDIRAEAHALYAKLGGAAFRVALAELDPEAAARLPAGDAQRLTRAYEVARSTGTSLSEWQHRQPPLATLRVAALLLMPPRAALYAACDARVERMVEAGAEAEAKALRARHLAPSTPAMKAVGVREFGALAEGRSTREQVVAAMQQATRNYAKRQYTWFRRRLPENESLSKLVIEAQFSERILPESFSFIRSFLLTGQS